MASGLPPEQTVRFVIDALNQANVPYMVTGSFASSTHGEPRATQDLDVVIHPTPSSLELLLQSFPEDRFYWSRQAATQALRDQGMFNIIEFASGWKIDLMLRKDRVFSRCEFDRRQEAVVAGQTLLIASPEDIVLAKLEWAKDGGSERQLEDAASVVRTQGSALDKPYIERWAAELCVADLWWQVAEG